MTAISRPQIDLSACAQEPIHTPGAIQPHGVLIATYPGEQRISHVSANFEASVGLHPGLVLGGDLDRLLGPAAAAGVVASLSTRSYAPANVLTLKLPIPIRPRRTVVVHRHLDRLIVELETAPPVSEDEGSLSKALTLIASLRRAETLAELCNCAAREIRLLTGADRVMVYRFSPNGDGTVIAEDKVYALESFLDLRYPASDIPEQARRLYLSQRVRGIPDVDYAPVALLTHPGGGELDMSFCALRAVSPVHLEYMRNMGVKASLATSLLQDGALWGMIVCHHRTEFVVPAEKRALCDVIGQLMAVLLQQVTEAEHMIGRLKCQQRIATLRDDMELSPTVAQGLLRREGALLELLQADGVIVKCGGETLFAGRTPPPAAAAAMMAAMRQLHGETIAAVDNAGQPGGLAAASRDVASGIMLMPISSSPGDAIAWFRREVTGTVRWGGDPRKPVAVDPQSPRLSPRKSFKAWSEQVSGCATPFSEADLLAAQELRRTITGLMLRQTEARLARLSAYDPLTGLANRRTCESHLERWRLDEAHPPAILLYLDLDRFKTINDLLGHGAGDELLVQLAERLRQMAPAGSVVGRLGSDEFLLFWAGAGKQQAELLGGVLVAELARPFAIKGQPYYAAGSIGIACSANTGADGLLRAADAAMFAAKRQGGCRAVIFEPAQHGVVMTNMQTEQDLFRALDHDELEIHYQPVVSVPDRSVCGFEALLRWRHPVRGWVSPMEFIPIAEDAGLITRIGAWVLAGAIRQAGVWRQAHPQLTVAVNVSARQLTEGGFSAELAGLLVRERLAPAAICIEVTESALMHQAAVRELQQIRALGVSVAVDDFGTGYSSLAYLQTLPVSIVKIDRSFVASLGSTPKAGRLFHSIVELAHTLDLSAVAEGCETEEQWRIIADAGCERVQGWLIARAMNAVDALVFLSRVNAADVAV
jgi:diguanylate cyclase (GGDEF)-like protein